MPSKIFSVSIFGFDGRVIEVETDILNGPASMTIVGLGDASVQESKERIRSAIKNSGAEYPRRKKTVNLAPADVRKHGPIFDLPIALGLLLKSGQIPPETLRETFVMGELALSGEVRRVPGALPSASFMKKQGFSTAIVPEENAAEVSIVEGLTIIPVRNLHELILHLRGVGKISPYENKAENSRPRGHTDRHNPENLWHFEDISGHEYVKRALAIAAAGGHNILLIGPAGTGKTLLARSMQSILPALTFEESLEVTKIYSLAGKLRAGESLMTMPPFRAVHHTASTISLVGGGAIPRPGEISMAHGGVLFLDELLEFPRSTLDCLRQPLEDEIVHVSRAAGSAVFPARFMLLAAANPCPCGFDGDASQACQCVPSVRDRYRQKLSGPLLDRIDIICHVPRLPFEKISAAPSAETSEKIRGRVAACRRIQRERNAATGNDERKSFLNGEIPGAKVKKLCALGNESQRIFAEAFRTMNASGRAYYRILKVARTIADMDQSLEIRPQHLAEALQYRVRGVMENV